MPDFDPSQHDQDHESNALVKGPRRVTHAHIGTAEARAQFEAAEEAEHRQEDAALGSEREITLPTGKKLSINIPP